MTDKVTIECSRGFGVVEHPDSGEEIDVEEPFRTTRETYAVLDEAYPGFRIVDEHNEEECGAELTTGGTCERPVGECPYHGED